MAFSMDYGTGFEMGTIDGLVADVDKSAGISVVGTANTGDYGMRMSRTGDMNIKFRDVDGSPSEYYIGVWVYPNYNNSQPTQIYFHLDDGYMYLQWSPPYWKAYHSDDGLIATGTVATDHDWQHVQIRLSIDGSSGVLQTKIDGIDDIDFSGDTQPGSATHVDYIQLYQNATSTGNRTSYWDDFCMGAGGWPGDIRFEALMPNADTATINWDGSDGDSTDNYALVDEQPMSSADYVESTTDGDQDKYECEDFDITNKDPLAVVLWAYAKKDEADAHKIKLILDDGTEDVGAALDLLTTYRYKFRVDESAPSGGDWTDALLDALEIGIESVIV